MTTELTNVQFAALMQRRRRGKGVLPRQHEEPNWRLYRVVGDAVWWIAAHYSTPDNVFQRAITDDFEPDEEIQRIVAINYEEALATTCRGDGDPDISMWEAFLDSKPGPHPVILACSEWP